MIAPLLSSSGKQYETVFTFLLAEACLDQNQEVQNASFEAALNIIRTKGDQDGTKILTILEEFLSKPESKDPEETQYYTV